MLFFTGIKVLFLCGCFFSEFPNSLVRKQRTQLIGITETHLYGQMRTTTCSFLEFKTLKCFAFCMLHYVLLDVFFSEFLNSFVRK
ncbi:hypothetical protein XENTR_v10011139 [Xenopus tropicalis]|nr:hypothetical protein XENTR_v10011139 [Xenopus tropicalis]